MPTIDTLFPTNITDTSATFQFEVLDDGDSEGCETWIANIGYKPHLSSIWFWLEDMPGEGEGIFQLNVDGLSKNTQYDVISRIVNSAGTSYGDIETFWISVQPTSPSVITLPAQNISDQSSQLELILTDDGDPSVTTQAHTRFVYWSIEGENKTTNWFLATENQTSTVTLNDLEPDTVYWYYAQATNSVGQAIGETLSFNTLSKPNLPPVAFDSNEQDTLIIQNFVNSIQTDPNDSHAKQGIVSYVEKSGNLATLDSNDILYSTVFGTSKASKIVSLLPKKKANGTIAGFYELSKDVRPDLIDMNEPNNIVLLELSIISSNNPDANTTSENSLKFWIPDDMNSVVLDSCFNCKPLTVQQVSTDPNLVYPLWDIRNVISKNKRQIPLPKLNNQVPSVSYAFFELSTSKELLDINGDNQIDVNDYIRLSGDLGKTGIYRSDIASIKGAGLPDGIIDANDEVTFINEYNKRYPENPISNPYVEYSESFESGIIEEPFTSSGDVTWMIDTNPYSGNYCVKSGDIIGTQISILEADFIVESDMISFYFKVSSEDDFDDLTFYIDNIEAGSWSGQMDWSKIEFPITPGEHNFKWIYSKDDSVSVGQDCAWVDNIEISSN